jgi:hypothetical protein
MTISRDHIVPSSHDDMEDLIFGYFSDTHATTTGGKRGFYPPPLVPKLFGPGLKGALVPVRAAGARPAPSPGS